MSFRDITSANSDFYIVQVTKFAEGHFIKGFEKKYKKAWDVTRKAIESMLERIGPLLGKTDKAEIISVKEGHKLLKMDFRVAGTNQSAKSSGNRLIAWINEEAKTCLVLLVYSKNDILTHNETAEWKAIIKGNYPESRGIFRL